MFGDCGGCLLRSTIQAGLLVYCYSSVIYSDETLVGQCIGLFFQQQLWMLESERSGNAPPTKPRLSSWILNPLLKSVQLHSACCHVNTSMWVILGHVLCYELFSHSQLIQHRNWNTIILYSPYSTVCHDRKAKQVSTGLAKNSFFG